MNLISSFSLLYLVNNELQYFNACIASDKDQDQQQSTLIINLDSVFFNIDV
jgi:hypothetical protein